MIIWMAGTNRSSSRSAAPDTYDAASG
jgi:hypothetical protein